MIITDMVAQDFVASPCLKVTHICKTVMRKQTMKYFRNLEKWLFCFGVVGFCFFVICLIFMVAIPMSALSHRILHIFPSIVLPVFLTFLYHRSSVFILQKSWEKGA